jgi:tRNA1(Val) A37 N6-methylase TrmN6
MVWMQIFLMVNDFSIDEFLGGRLKIKQPLRGYRAGVDPVLLAASVNAYEGEDILDLGCGVGVASLCLSQRVSGLNIYGIEIQSDYAKIKFPGFKYNKCEYC